MRHKCKIEVSNLPVACHSLQPAVVSAKRNVESDDGLASLDEVQVLFLDTSHRGRLVVEEFDLLEEARLQVLIKFGAELGQH